MNKKRISIVILTLVLLVGIMLGIAIPAMARGQGGKVNTTTDWLASSGFTPKKCAGATCAAAGHKDCNFAYSFAVIGDTQNLNIQDIRNNTNHMGTLYQWIVDNKSTYNIQYVMGVGDITQAYHDGYHKGNTTYKKPGVDTSNGVWDDEWKHAAAALKLLDDAGIPYSLVRGNHDIYAGFNGVFGVGNATFGTDSKEYYNDLLALSKTKDEGGQPMAGLRIEGRIEETYRKFVIGDHKYIVVTLDWLPTSRETDCVTADELCVYDYCTVHTSEADCTANSDDCVMGCEVHNGVGAQYCKTEVCAADCEKHNTLGWLDKVLTDNSDYEAIITTHDFIMRDGSLVDDIEDVFPYENLVGDRLSTWGQVCYDSGNVPPRMLWDKVLSKHANVSMVLCGHVDEDNIITTQLKGDNGNTVSCFLIDGQTIDSSVEPVGLVAMYYMSADGKVANVEYISTVREAANKDAYLRAVNQFEVNLDYGTAWTSTPYGQIPTEIYNKYTFHVMLDDDSDTSTVNTLFGSYDSYVDTLRAIYELNGIGSLASRQAKSWNIVMSKDYTFSASDIGLYNQNGNCPGDVVFDLNGKTFTAASGAVLLPYYNSTTSFTPYFAMKNGNVVMNGTAKLFVTQHGHKNATNGRIGLDLTDLNITYGSDASGAIIDFYGGSTGGPSYVDLNVTNCKIDSSASSKAVTLFKFADTKNNSNVILNMKGGSIIGSTAANTTLFTQNYPGDKVTFSKDTSGNYTTVTLTDSAAIGTVYHSETEDKYLEFGTPTASSGKYVYSITESTSILTKYGPIPKDYQDTEKYPFIVFNGGKCQAAVDITVDNAYRNLFNNTLDTAALRSGSVVLMTRDIATGGDTWDLAHINDVLIDLGGFTFTRSDNFMFHARGREATAYTSNVTVTNGTIKTASGKNAIIAYSNEASGQTTVDIFNFVFNGVTFDISAGGNANGVCIVDSFKDGITGASGSVTLNDCVIDRGDYTDTTVLFNLKDADNKNKNDITVTVNGGTLKAASLENLTIATLDAERESGAGSPDSFTLGKGEDGKAFEIILPTGVSVGDATYEFTAGIHRLAKLADNSDGTTSYNFDYVYTEYGIISQTYASIENYPIVVFYNGTLVGGYSSYKDAINAAVSKVNTAAKVAVCDTVYVVLRKDYVVTEDSYFSGARGNLIVDLQGFTLSSSTNGIAGLYLNYTTATADFLGYTSNFNIKNGTIVNNRADLPIIAIDQGGTTTLTGVSAKKLYFGFENVTFKTSKAPVLHNYDKVTALGIDVTVKCDGCTFDFTGATEKVAMISLFNRTVKADVELINCSAIATDLDKYSIYKIGDNGTATLTMDADGTYLTVTQSTNAAPETTFVTTDGQSPEYTLISSDDTNKKYVYELKGSAPEVDTHFTVEGYGKVPLAYASETDFPILLFYNGSFVDGGAYASFTSALDKAKTLVDTAAKRDVCDTVYIVMRADFTSKGESLNLMTLLGKVVVDLQGKKINAVGNLSATNTKQCFINSFINYDKITADNVEANLSNSAEITFMNGTLRNDNSSYHMFGFDMTADSKLGDAFSEYSGKEITYNFDNVKFENSTKQPIMKNWTKAGEGIDVNVNINDCTFDFTDSTSGLVMIQCQGTDIVYDINFTGNIDIIASNFNNYNIYTISTNGKDKVTFAEGSKDKITLTQTTNTAPTFTFAEGGVTYKFAHTSTVDGKYICKLGTDVVAEEYGTIPAYYSNANMYPIVLFDASKKFISGYTAWDDNYTGAIKTNCNADGLVYALLRNDVTIATDYDTTNWTGSLGTIEIDLGGKTIYTPTNKPLFKPNNTSATANQAINVKNGEILLRGAGSSLIYYSSGAPAANGTRFDISFTDVRIGYAAGATTTAIVKGMGGTADIVTYATYTFTNCDIDLKTNAPAKAITLFNLASANKNHAASVVIDGGTISFGRSDFVLATLHTDTAIDSVTFTNTASGEYTKIVTNSGVALPAMLATVNNGTLTSKPVSTDGTTTTYVLVPTASMDLDFTPKASVTLDSNLIFNIYIPKHESLTSATVSEIDGFKLSDYSLTEDGKYYIVPVELSADEAAKTLTLVVTLDLDGTSLNGKFTFSTVKYAQKLLAMESASVAEKTLAKDMLAYIKSAYEFFNADDKATVAAEIDAVLGAYESTIVIDTANAKKTVTGLTGATFVLGARPAVRFYFGGDYAYNLFSFKVGERALEITDDNYNASENYVEFSLYAYEMTEVFSYTVKDTAVAGEYNLISYYAYASGSGTNDYKGDDKEALTDLVAKFYNYCASAKAYRDSVINK